MSDKIPILEAKKKRPESSRGYKDHNDIEAYNIINDQRKGGLEYTQQFTFHIPVIIKDNHGASRENDSCLCCHGH